MLTLEWRSGKRRALPRARLIDATLEDGELLLSFTEREVTFHGFNLGGLLEAVVECRLEKVWELSANYRPSANLTHPCISKIEVRNSDCDRRVSEVLKKGSASFRYSEHSSRRAPHTLFPLHEDC